MEKAEFTYLISQKTKTIAINCIKLVSSFPNKTEYFVLGKQLIRSSCSTAANYRSTLRARSRKEFFAKMSIVVEECDETLFWLEVLEEAQLISPIKISNLKENVLEVLKIVSKARKTSSNSL